MSAAVQSPALTEAIKVFFEASALLDPLRLRIWDLEGLTVTQLRLLSYLAEQEGLSNAALAERLYVTRPSVSALLERLERGGFLRREMAPNDRRSIRIWLEDRGRRAVSHFAEETFAYTTRLMETLSEADLRTMTGSLRKFVEAGRERRARDLEQEAVTADAP